MPTKDFSNEEYDITFSNKRIKRAALKHALDIRKFEIELYWKRAAYFWTFIGATFAGYIAVRATNTNDQQNLSVLLSCVGMVFSFAWFLVNRGSKHWQENWEKHVDMLEDDLTGPLYKVVLTRGSPKTLREWVKHFFTGPSPYSVSKINQIISLYVTVLWLVLLAYSIHIFKFGTDTKVFYSVTISISLFACLLILIIGRTYPGGFWHKASIRTTEIRNN